MSFGQRSVLKVVLLAGSALILTGLGGHAATPGQAPCKLTAKLVVVDFDNVKHRNILNHAFAARRKGHARTLHIRRYEEKANRRASLKGIPTKPGHHRDEYPPAMSDEGGKGASVRYVKISENTSAGSVMGHQLAPYCNEQRFIYERWPKSLTGRAWRFDWRNAPMRVTGSIATICGVSKLRFQVETEVLAPFTRKSRT